MLAALTRADHWLIDRVFQRLVNALHDRAEPHVVAETLLLGAAVMVIGAAGSSLSQGGIGAGPLLDAALNVGGATWLWVWYRRHGGISAGRLNPFRTMPVFVLARLFSLVALAPDVLALLGVDWLDALGLSYGRGMPGVFGLASDALTACGLYVAACVRPPPRSRTARSFLERRSETLGALRRMRS